MKISIIGSGWLAQPLADQFLEDKHHVTVTTTQEDKLVALKTKGFNAMQYVLGDQLAKPSALFEVDVLVIAITGKDIEAYDILMDQLNDYPSLNIIYISSTSVYQNNDQVHSEDSQSLNADNPLLEIEKLIQTHPNATVIRMAGLVGPGRHPGRFFTKDKPIKNPNAKVNLIHLDDCIGIIDAVITQDQWNQVFNACADTHPTKGKFYPFMSKQLNRPASAIASSSNQAGKVINNDKVKTLLAYQFFYPDVMTMEF